MVTANSRSAIQIVRPGTAEVRTVPSPRSRPDYVIAETKAFALNPTDIHHIDHLGGSGTILGCDWSGIVRDVGANVTRFKPGDAVYGVCHGGNTVEPEDGAYADIIACKEFATMHKPDFLNFAEAAALGVTLTTIGQALYWVMKLPLPSPDGPATSEKVIFVYGGSSATGTIAIQAAKLSGFQVYTACSPANFDLVQSRGADKWFDYNQPDCIDQVHATGASIAHIVDCIGTDDTSAFCSKVLSPTGGHYHSIKAPLPESFKALWPEESVVATTALGYTMLGERFEFPGGIVFPEEPEQEAFAKRWAPIAEDLVRRGLIQPHPVQVRNGGLKQVLEGVEGIRMQGPRGRKMVYVKESN